MRIKSDKVTETTTTRGGSVFYCSIEGAVTGRGCHDLVIDDPMKAIVVGRELARQRVSESFTESLYSRLNNKETGSIAVVAQRLHEDDLIGRLLKQPDWHHLNVPSIATEDVRIPIGPAQFYFRPEGEVLHAEWESKESLDKTRAAIGHEAFEAQFQQQPLPEQGNIIRQEWLIYYDEHPPLTPDSRIVQSWDIAVRDGARNNYSVCTTWVIANSKYYLIDVFRGRLEFPDLRRKIALLAARYHAKAVLIEDAGSGSLLLDALRSDLPLGMPRPIGIKPRGSKEERMRIASYKFEAGQVYLPRQSEWLAVYKRELLGFPNTEHDDQADSTSQFLNWESPRRSVANLALSFISVRLDNDGWPDTLRFPRRRRSDEW